MRMLLVLFASLSFMASASADCVSKSGIRNYSYNGNVLLLEAFGVRWAADVGACPELRWANRIDFDSFSGGFVCDGDSVVIYGPRGDISATCHIWSLERADLSLSAQSRL